MKILEIVPGLQSGGAERLVVDLCNEFADMGHDVTLLSIKDLNKDKIGFYVPEISKKVDIINFEGDRSKIQSVRDIDRVIKDGKYDVAHIHMVQEFCFLSMLMRHKTTKFFVTIHIDAIKFISRRFINKWIGKFIINYPGRKRWVRYIAISDKNRNDITAKYPQIDCSLIYNGRKPIVPSDKIDDVAREIDHLRSKSDSMVFLHIARCAPQKNQVLLMESFNQIIKDGVNADLLVIGDGFENTKLGREIKDAAGNNEHIHFLGQRSNVGDYIINSDVFLLSSHYEGMPITLIEALSCGTPAISTPVCGSIDVIKDGENGILSDEITKESYVTAIYRFIANKDTIQKYAKNDSLKGNFDIHKTAEGYINLFSI